MTIETLHNDMLGKCFAVELDRLSLGYLVLFASKLWSAAFFRWRLPTSDGIARTAWLG